MRYSLYFLIFLLLASLLWWKWPHIRASVAKPPVTNYKVSHSGVAPYKKAYFAAGCFWCAESGFEKYP